MAQHLPIQAKHHCQLKQHTRKQRTTAFPPGSAHTPPGETVPDRLAVFTHRQAPTSSQTHCFLVTAWRSTPCRQAPLGAVFSHAKPIAWQLSIDRQEPYQNNTFLVYDTPINPVYHLTPLHRSHKNPNLIPRIGESTNIICKQLHVLHPNQSTHLSSPQF
ncbi:hypothetical protein DEO72_LG10g2121 [Vigna unguiculata]|uniref:Uncharacterized protein n=1 Tax=Vigna unguiculata TaxID=3917 RepID=A0A4D6NEA0_VIGUN|nr:hypothetical protein DEO72_LG10g2121 [Vigna unguiculata]